MKEQDMGKVEVDAKLWNIMDEGRNEPVTSVTCRALVDSGAVMVVIPERLAQALKLTPSGTTTVRYADMRTSTRQIVKGLCIEVQGREAQCRAVVEPDLTRVLLGQIALEDLDLYVDCRGRSLVPRPESPDMPMHEAYCAA